jgi:hypothetical protein
MTTLPAWARRLLTKELRFVADGMEFDREAAQKILALLAPRKKNEKQRKTAKDKELVKALRAARTAAIRAEVMERADGKCELCGGPGALEMHHLERGSGRRREHQTIGNCMGICGFCHREYHREPSQFYSVIESWAAEHGYPKPRALARIEAQAWMPSRGRSAP